jgi:hypothetical protein
MYKSIVAALGVVGTASAQESVLNLFLLGFTSQSIVGSVITSVSSAEKWSTSLADFQNRTQQRQHIHSIVATQTIAEGLVVFLRQYLFSQKGLEL